MTTVQLASFMEVSVQQIHHYKIGGMPKTGPNLYDLREVWAYFRDRWKSKVGEESKPLDLARQREAEARTKKHDIELEIMRGSLIRTPDAQQLLGAMAARVAAEFDALPGRTQLDPRLRGLITDECKSASRRIAVAVRECGESLRTCGRIIDAPDPATDEDGG